MTTQRDLDALLEGVAEMIAKVNNLAASQGLEICELKSMLYGTGTDRNDGLIDRNEALEKRVTELERELRRIGEGGVCGGGGGGGGVQPRPLNSDILSIIGASTDSICCVISGSAMEKIRKDAQKVGISGLEMNALFGRCIFEIRPNPPFAIDPCKGAMNMSPADLVQRLQIVARHTMAVGVEINGQFIRIEPYGAWGDAYGAWLNLIEKACQ